MLSDEDCNHLAVKGKWGIRRSNQSNRIYRNPDGSVVKKRYERNRSKSVGVEDRKRHMSEYLKKRRRDNAYEKNLMHIAKEVDLNNGDKKKRKYERKGFFNQVVEGNQLAKQSVESEEMVESVHEAKNSKSRVSDGGQQKPLVSSGVHYLALGRGRRDLSIRGNKLEDVLLKQQSERFGRAGGVDLNLVDQFTFEQLPKFLPSKSMDNENLKNYVKKILKKGRQGPRNPRVSEDQELSEHSSYEKLDNFVPEKNSNPEAKNQNFDENLLRKREFDAKHTDINALVKSIKSLIDKPDNFKGNGDIYPIERTIDLVD
jgi:hypothetical protein